MNAHPYSWTASSTDATTARLADGVDAGVPLDELFLALADDSESRQVRRVSRALTDRLAAGDDLPTAIASSAPLLPPAFRRAVASVSDARQIAPLLRGMAAHQTARHRLRGRIRAAILYPLLVLSLLTLVVFALCFMVLPQFREMFLDWELELPLITKALLQFAEWSPWIAGVLIALLVVSIVLGLLPGTGRIVHWFRTSVPFAGQFWNYSAQHEFSSLLAELTGAGLPLDDALHCTSQSLRDRNLARASRIIARKHEAGIALSQGIAESLHFDRALAGLVSWGEANNDLPAALRQAAVHFEQEIDQLTAFLRRVAPPMLYVGVLSVMFLFIFALIVPLGSIMNGFWW